MLGLVVQKVGLQRVGHPPSEHEVRLMSRTARFGRARGSA